MRACASVCAPTSPPTLQKQGNIWTLMQTPNGMCVLPDYLLFIRHSIYLSIYFTFTTCAGMFSLNICALCQRWPSGGRGERRPCVRSYPPLVSPPLPTSCSASYRTCSTLPQKRRSLSLSLPLFVAGAVGCLVMSVAVCCPTKSRSI